MEMSVAIISVIWSSILRAGILLVVCWSWILNKDTPFHSFFVFISDFIPFSPNLVANHTPISSITPPPPTAYTSSLAAPVGSSDPIE